MLESVLPTTAPLRRLPKLQVSAVAVCSCRGLQSQTNSTSRVLLEISSHTLRLSTLRGRPEHRGESEDQDRTGRSCLSFSNQALGKNFAGARFLSSSLFGSACSSESQTWLWLGEATIQSHSLVTDSVMESAGRVVSWRKSQDTNQLNCTV
jgi:hypothetical protein